MDDLKSMAQSSFSHSKEIVEKGDKPEFSASQLTLLAQKVVQFRLTVQNQVKESLETLEESIREKEGKEEMRKTFEKAKREMEDGMREKLGSIEVSMIEAIESDHKSLSIFEDQSNAFDTSEVEEELRMDIKEFSERIEQMNKTTMGKVVKRMEKMEFRIKNIVSEMKIEFDEMKGMYS